jgi:hypothetical protein
MKSPGDEEVTVTCPAASSTPPARTETAARPVVQRSRNNEIDLARTGACDLPARATDQHLIRRLPKGSKSGSERSRRHVLLRAEARAINHNGGPRGRRRCASGPSHNRRQDRIEAREIVRAMVPTAISGLNDGPSGMPGGAEMNFVVYWPVRREAGSVKPLTLP